MLAESSHLGGHHFYRICLLAPYLRKGTLEDESRIVFDSMPFENQCRHVCSKKRSATERIRLHLKYLVREALVAQIDVCLVNIYHG